MNADFLIPSNNCLVCCRQDAAVRFRTLELCLSCLNASVQPLEPGYRVEFLLIPEGYDYPEDSLCKVVATDGVRLGGVE